MITFKLTKTRGHEIDAKINFNTIEELLEFVKSTQLHRVVIITDKHEELPEIEIYDDYRE